ncbi:MAG TPA: hypothetical protein VEK57_08795 [Thermoanaerobaculia bacterium]|nr:hypothetical protein [Thermoanaerobaculia bacterium]
MPLELETLEPSSPHATAAQDLLDRIDTIKPEVRELTHGSKRDARRLGQIAAIPDAALEAVSSMVQRNERLMQVAGAPAEKMRDAMAFALAHEPVVQALFAAGRALAHTIRAARAEAGYSARDVYVMATRLSTRPEGVELIPFVEDLKKKMSRGKKRKTVADPPSATPADPATPATPGKK